MNQNHANKKKYFYVCPAIKLYQTNKSSNRYVASRSDWPISVAMETDLRKEETFLKELYDTVVKCSKSFFRIHLNVSFEIISDGSV